MTMMFCDIAENDLNKQGFFSLDCIDEAVNIFTR